MTHTNIWAVLAGEPSRRTVLKTGALASGGLALGVSSTGNALAQDQDTVQNQMKRGIMFNEQVIPGATFTIRSEPIDWTPVISGDEEDEAFDEEELLITQPGLFQDFQTRVIEYEFAGQVWALLMIRQDVDVQEGQQYQLSTLFEPFGVEEFGEFGIDEEELGPDFGPVEEEALGAEIAQLGLVTVQFSPVTEGGEGGG